MLRMILASLLFLTTATVDLTHGQIVTMGDTNPALNAPENFNLNGNLLIGETGVGSLNIGSGKRLGTTGGFIGLFDGASRTANITGSDSSWNIANFLVLGSGGAGEMTVETGGSVSNSIGIVGGQLPGTSGAHGTVTVSGTGSQWSNTSFMQVGNFGQGTLRIDSGGIVTNGFSVIGQRSGSLGMTTVQGLGSRLDNTGNLVVGSSGSGSLEIVAGGAVSNQFGSIGSASGGSGTASVNGAGSQWTSLFELSVGNSGTGTLNVANDGAVSVGTNLRIGQLGTMNLSGGEITASTLNLSTPGATFNMTGGTLDVETIIGNFTQEGGTLAPGDSPGLTDIQGDYTLMSGANVELEIAGLTRGDTGGYDAIDVTGMATLNGTLQVNFISGFTAMLNDTFNFFNFGSFSGGPTFDFSNAVLASGLEWDTSQFSTNGTVSVVASSTAVPEPSTLVTSSIVLCSLLSRRRRRAVLKC